MDLLVDLYLEGKRVAEQPVTLSGLILALGLCSRESFDNYGRRAEYVDSVKRAKLHVAMAYEDNLVKPHAAGSIFALKNMGWTDRQDIGLEAVGGLAGMLRGVLGDTDGGGDEA